ncbi:MAG: hypothetical protein ACREA9_10390 [Pyrinomonadaceae bacterium]
MKRFNWQIWSGFLLSVFAFLSYPLLFVRFPVTRDFPWANLLLFGVAVALVVFGVRRAFASDRSHPLRSKIAGGVLATLSVVILGLFVFTAFIMSRWLPASHGAPQVGQRAPDFILTDTTGRQVSLSDLLSSPLDASTGTAGVPPANEREGRIAPKGVLLIFYRGYW